uniref:Nucleolar protein 58/56 N-terminal domain-containing protein n=1 Tax=Mola mola TaxID=94237 RepID=A0A3Q3WM60_MOLML
MTCCGYALFAVKEVEEIGMLLPQVEESVLSIGKFNSMVSLAAFFPFKSAQAALENMNAISEGVVHADLKLFLETNLPLSGKKKAVLGVSDAKIGAALQEEFNLSIQTSGGGDGQRQGSDHPGCIAQLDGSAKSKNPI